MTKAKKIIPFIILIFIFSIIFYFLNFDYKGTRNKACESLCGLENQAGNIPQSWLDRYQIEIKDESDIATDHDGDGLNLLEEYNNSTNPLDADTDKDNYSDGQEVKNGYSPIGQGQIDLDKDNLPDVWEKKVGLDLKKNDYKEDNDQDGLWNYNELAHGTDPLVADTDKDGFSDWDEIKNGYDPTKGGDAKSSYEIIIEKINVNAPIVWSLSNVEADIMEDLKNGVIRYPDTGIPGKRGNTVISGHSSNYSWAQGNYNFIFQDLNDLENGDEITIKSTYNNQKSFEYKYRIVSKNVVSADDPQIFESSQEPSLTLVTCWPLRTNWKRLIVKAEMQ